MRESCTRPVELVGSGVLLLVGAATPLVLAPGYQSTMLSALEPTELLLLLIGVLLVAWGTFRFLLQILRATRPARAVQIPWHHGWLAVGVAVFLMMVLLSYGAIPGLYLPTSGSRYLEVAGCGGSLGAGWGPDPGAPNGFPPDSRVNLRWSAEGGTDVKIAIYVYPVNSHAGGPKYALEGVSGTFSFVGSGGWAWVDASNASACTSPESVEVSWSYTYVW